jgi:hypothetical protein
MDICSVGTPHHESSRRPKITQGPRRLNRFRKNVNIVNPATNGAGPIESQNTGWLVSAAAMVPRSRSVKLKLEALMSFPVQPDRFGRVGFLAGLFKSPRERFSSGDGVGRLAVCC